ncbi:hypothetical protein J4H92_12775 [Leucobacter weissii]|uniref:Dinucleotide-utilizing enzyme n=1 Tax=Leucobacter weissii TaxID=1983706 RepID=A0A939MMY1_9MICO|nr:hypothetical protein [Leucobacter weissii]MBO1902820.1 hypothetical protein [Leucobacter weissii]
MPSAPQPPARPRLRILPAVSYGALVLLSLGSAAIGGSLVATNLDTLVTKLADNTATAIEVYGNPSAIVLGSVLLGAGIVGILLALAVGAIGGGRRWDAPPPRPSEAPLRAAAPEPTGSGAAEETAAADPAAAEAAEPEVTEPEAAEPAVVEPAVAEPATETAEAAAVEAAEAETVAVESEAPGTAPAAADASEPAAADADPAPESAERPTAS